MANEAKLCTFINIFGETFEYEIEDENKQIQTKSVKLEKILIPKIQRDYAQGRENSDVNRIRERFLDALHEAVVDENPQKITLDFVYGDIEDEGNNKGLMTPLDGQQRLTTLFLLHWYAAKKAGLKYGDSDYEFLKNFSYDTRPSARDFCKSIVEDFNPDFKDKLSDEIRNQAWFPLHWEHDSTIKSMLVMLDAIDGKFSDIDKLWERLNDKDEPPITFYVLPIKDMGLTDDLYIKMNSRGKPLTMFEHFKAELEHELSEIDSKLADEVISRFDIQWTDLIWDSEHPDIVDDKFLRYFRFICDILRYNQGKSIGKDNDEFSLIEELFSLKKLADTKAEQEAEELIENRKSEIRKNVKFLEDCFDCWIEIKKTESIAEFFGRYISKEGHAEGKIISDGKVNYFEYCLEKYVEMKDKDSAQQFNLGDSVRGSNAGFSLSDIIIFYAFVKYVINNYISNEKKIDDNDFRRRLRIIQNLVKNSSDDLREDSMTAILGQVDDILLKGELKLAPGRRFNNEQFLEEQKKLAWTNKHPESAEALFKLEDHKLLYGQVDILGNSDGKAPREEYLKPEYFERFFSLFECDFDLINCALMTVGDYKQNYNHHYQIGATIENSWKHLFHHSASSGFKNTQKTLQELLSKPVELTNEGLKKLKDDYIKSHEEDKKYDWRYYYLKYDKIFRPKFRGKYYWHDFNNNPYEMIVIEKERRSTTSYQPFIRAAVSGGNFEDLGESLKLNGKYIITCKNNAYIIKDLSNSKIDRIRINQNNGIDTEDRIKTLQRHLKRKYNL